MSHVSRKLKIAAVSLALATSFGCSQAPVQSQKTSAAAVYAAPVTNTWVARVHEGLVAAEQAELIDYEFYQYSKMADQNHEMGDNVRKLREYCKSGVQLIVGESFAIPDEARALADECPDTAFLMADPGKPYGENFAVFDSYLHESAYLMGILAGSMTETNKIGMVGAFNYPEINNLFNAFIAGAKSVNPEIESKVAFIDAWFDPAKAKEASLAQIDAGVDILYAERDGVLDAARERGVLAFGNLYDVAKNDDAKDVIVTSSLWIMEPAVVKAVERIKSGTFSGEDYQEFSLMKYGGNGIAPYYDFEDKIPARAKATVEKVRAKIISGEFTVELVDDVAVSTF